jgi:glycosyltransferase involved in cell wall biosynthesis
VAISQITQLNIFVSHPTQFEGPLYPKIAQSARFNLKVLFWNTAKPMTELVTPTGIKPQWDNLSLINNYSFATLPANLFDTWRYLTQSVLPSANRHVFLINGWSAQAARLAFLVGLLNKIPIILRLDTVDLYPLTLRQFVRRKVFKPILYRIPKAFMATSTLTKQHLLHSNVKENEIFIFPYALDNHFLTQLSASHRERRANLRKELGIDSDQTVVMAALFFVPREGVWDLLRAYANLTSWHNSTILLLAGDGPQRVELEAFSHSHPFMKVIFTGWVKYSRLLELYALSDLFVHPGIEEQWGCSVQEAAAFSLPIVGSDLVGATYDLVRPGENGLTYRGGDFLDLRNVLTVMLERQSEWPKMGQRSWDIVQDWGHERAIGELERALDYVLSKTL